MELTQIKIHPYLYAGITKISRTSEQIYEQEKNKMAVIYSCSDFIENRTRIREYVWIRNIFFYNLVNKYKITPTKLSTLCPYDRTTILHSLKTVESLMLGVKPDKEFMEYVGKVDLINLK